MGNGGQLAHATRSCRVAHGQGQSSSWVAAHLLHDASLALGEGDVAARLVLDELDLNLPPLATGLVVVVIVVVGSRARALGAAIRIGLGESAVAVVGDVVSGRGRLLLLVVGDFAGHCVGGGWWLAVTIWEYCIAISRLDVAGGERGRPRESGLLSGPKERRMRVAATKPKATFSYGWNRQGSA